MKIIILSTSVLRKMVVTSHNTIAMRHFFKYIMILAVAAISFSACNDSEIETSLNDEGYYYTFALGSPETRSVLASDENGKYGAWESGDQLGTAVSNGNPGYSNVDVTSTPVTFQIYKKDGLKSGDVIYAYYPYTNSASEITAVPFSIPENQNQDSDQFDFDAMPMVAEGFVVPENLASNTNNTPIGDINLYNLGSVIDFQVYSTNNTYAAENVLSVKFDASAAIAGSFSKDITTVQSDDESSLAISGYSGTSVTTTVTNPTALGATRDNAAHIYMVVAPSTGITGTVTLTTDKAVYTYTISSAQTFKRAGLKSFGLNLGTCQNRVSDVTTVFTVGENTAETTFEIASIFPSVKNGIKFSYEKGESNNAPSFHVPYRWYSGSTVTISAGNVSIKSIEVEFSNEDNGKYILGSDDVTVEESGSYSVSGNMGTWVSSGTVTSVTFTAGKQARFSSIKVYTDADGSETVVTSNPTIVVPEAFELSAGSSLSKPASSNYGTIVYSSSNTSVATVSENGVVNGVSAGQATITASVAGITTDYYVINSVSDSYAVTVNQAVVYDDVDANDWSYIFTNNPWGAITGDKDLVSGETTINWKLNAQYAQYNSGYLALNSGSNTYAATISTNNVVTNVNNVVVYAKTNSGKAVTLTVKVGDTTLGSETLNSVTGLTAYTFSSSTALSGKITIEFTEPLGGYQIKQIRINPVTYNIALANVSNGSIYASALTAFAGDEVTLTATPADGYVLDSWIVTDANSTAIPVTNDVFTMPSSAVTVSASFKSVNTPPSNGSVLFSCDFGTSAVALANYTGGTSYNNASSITYTASDANYVKIDTGSAGNMTSANLFIGGKNGGAGLTATISGIRSYGATSVTVTWASNSANSKVSITESSTDAVTSASSASNSATFTLSGTETTITLVFTGIGKYNTRIDNVSVLYN